MTKEQLWAEIVRQNPALDRATDDETVSLTKRNIRRLADLCYSEGHRSGVAQVASIRDRFVRRPSAVSDIFGDIFGGPRK